MVNGDGVLDVGVLDGGVLGRVLDGAVFTGGAVLTGASKRAPHTAQNVDVSPIDRPHC